MKQLLVSVLAAGCISRFRNGIQFTKTPKEVLVNESELAALEADSYLSVNVIPDDLTADSNGADNENAITNNVVVTKDTHVVPDTPTETTTIMANMASDDGTIVVDTAKSEAYASADATAHDAVKADDPTISNVPQESVVDLNTVIQSMRGLNLDMTADKPTVRELKTLGLDVSAKERNDAWDVLVTEHAAK